MGHIYWCAACGNPDIVIENTKSGYSMGKGIVGAAVLGPVGAVAGLDGKDTVSFYCPKCGAKLNHCMPEYEVASILRIEEKPELFRNLIEQKHKKYPNMIMPKGWEEQETAAQGTDKELDFEQLLKILQSSDEYDCEDKVYKFILQYGKITSKQVDLINRKLERLNFTREKKLFNNALDEISNGYGNNYKVRLDFIGDIQEDGYTVYTAARDIDEIKAWRLEMKAQKKVRFELQRNEPDVYKAYVECVRSLIGDTPVTIEEAEQAIIDKNPNINDDNPYMSRELANAVCGSISNKDARIQFDGETLKTISTKRAEDEIRWEIEEKWRDGVAGDHASTMRKMAPVLKSERMITTSELYDRTGVKQPQSSFLLKKLADKGICSKQTLNRIVYYSLNPEYKSWSVQKLGELARNKYIQEKLEEYLPKALSLFKNNSGKSFWEIMGDQLNSDFVTKRYYECFMLFESEGDARRTEKPKEYIWEFIDKNAELRKKLENEKRRLEILIENYKSAWGSRIEELSNKKEELRKRKFDESEFISRISGLEDKREGLVSRLSTLGFFAFKEKKETNKKIAECDQELEEARSDLEKAKEAFSNETRKLITPIEEELSRYEKELNTNRTYLCKIEADLLKTKND